MIEKLTNLIKYDSESALLDFKKEEYQLGKNFKKYDLLKDILAFLNHPSNDEKFIIIGIKEKNGFADTFFSIESITDQAQYQSFIDENIEPKVNFEYKSFTYDSYKLSYFRIFNNLNRPYLLKKSINYDNVNLQIGDGYIRQGTKNRRLDRDDFELIYKNRLNQKDRKIDLNIIVNSGKSEIQEVDFLQYLDFEILNSSNKSIEIDIEIEFPHRDEYKVLSKNEVEKKLEELNKPKHGYLSNQVSRISPIPSFRYSVSDNGKSKIFERNKHFGQKNAIILTQNNSEKFIFDKEIIIFSTEPCELEFIVIIRSDDFIEGPLIKKINYNLDFPLKLD